MTIDSGRLRHRLALQELVELVDSAGDVIQDQNTGEIARIWTTIKEVWAAVEPLSGREFIQSQAYQSKVTGRIVVRWLPGMNAGMRFRHRRNLIPDVYYNIEAVLPDKDSGQEYMTVLVSQGVVEPSE